MPSASLITDKLTVGSIIVRILRFLTMIDPTVNLSVIREADGIVSNLDCHNIKIYAESDKLFYLAQFQSNYILITEEGYIRINYDTSTGGGIILNSYSAWLNAYKRFIDNDFFIKNQNIYDLLAGVFSCKLKFRQEYYIQTVTSLNKELNDFISLSKNPLTDYQDTLFYGRDDYFTIGFDEILLLKMFKEIISVSRDNIKIGERSFKIENPADIENVNRIRNELFYSENIYILRIKINPHRPIKGKSKSSASHTILKPNIIEAFGIISADFVEKNILKEYVLSKPFLDNLNEMIPDDGYYTNYDLYITIDSLLLKHIREDCKIMFNILYLNNMIGGTPFFATELLNAPHYYFLIHDKYYDNQTGGSNYKAKYLKYKAKYLELKNINKTFGNMQ
jgi:hypothetical protein